MRTSDALVWGVTTKMTTTPQPPSTAWGSLAAHAREIREVDLRSLFADDPGRGERFHLEAEGFYLDFSKNLITRETLALLAQLTDHCGLARRRELMFRGGVVNPSENRPALHVALRMPKGALLVVNGVDVVESVHGVLERMADFATRVREGQWRGCTGQPIKNVVNIGIGGSDLGPKMAYEALRYFSRRDITFRFVSNVDGTDLVESLRDLRPEETLFIVSSKTFGTLETLTNATSARNWLVDQLGESAVERHFVAVSTNAARVSEFGIDPANMFEFWDWVGGRYSLESAIGLSTMVAVGPEQFMEMLAGSHAMDQHFLNAPTLGNLPVVMGLMAVWNHVLLGHPSVGVMPYDQYLHRLPAYLQQLTMESNGKSVTLSGESVVRPTGPIYWGEPGTNGQHSFYQLLHQGTVTVPVDLIGFAKSLNPLSNHHDILMSNVFAQAQALAFGRTAAELTEMGVAPHEVPHRVMTGNRPSNVLLARELTPRVLGSLIALYEHSVFVQGTLYDVDSFDQWGVELGKELAASIVPELDSSGEGPRPHDSSTTSLIAHYIKLKSSEAP